MWIQKKIIAIISWILFLTACTPAFSTELVEPSPVTQEEIVDLTTTPTSLIPTEPPPTLAPAPTIIESTEVGGEFKITIIYDNTAFDESIKAEWGFAALVEYAGHKILFDTRGTAPTFLENLGLLEIDPLEIEAVVISHEHGDSTTGLLPFLEIADSPTVYLLSTFSSSFIYRVSAQIEVVKVVQPVEIFPGMFSTGTLSGHGIAEQGLVVDRGEDIVVITGCLHPGIANLVRRGRTVAQPEAEADFKPIALVIGGFHLLEASRGDVEDISAELRSLGV